MNEQQTPLWLRRTVLAGLLGDRAGARRGAARQGRWAFAKSSQSYLPALVSAILDPMMDSTVFSATSISACPTCCHGNS